MCVGGKGGGAASLGARGAAWKAPASVDATGVPAAVKAAVPSVSCPSPSARMHEVPA